jgi:uncharacterized protein YmfQ (DUF2313 family)
MGLLLLLDDPPPPTPARPAAAYASMLGALLPPGRLWRLFESLLSALLLGSADELARVDARGGDLLNEADPTTAVELLPEYERELELVAAPSIEERRANILARRVRQQKFRPVDFQIALAPLLALSPNDVTIIERTHAYCVSVGDDREIFAFFVYRNPSIPGTYFIASAQALVDDMAPSHTLGTVLESVNMLCDDPHSLCDRDLLGA